MSFYTVTGNKTGVCKEKNRRRLHFTLCTLSAIQQRRKLGKIVDHVIDRRCGGLFQPVGIEPADGNPCVDAALDIAGEGIADQ